MASHKCIEGLLLQNGIQYDVEFTDHPQDLKAIGQYELLILPFGYALSDEAFAAIKKAVDNGTRLLAFDRLGEATEFGRQREEPLLKPLLGHKNVKYVKANLAESGMDLKVRAENLAIICDLLAGSGHTFKRNEADIIYIARRVDPRNYLLYLANWERDKTAKPVLGLPLPEGRYGATVCSSKENGLRQGLIGGKGRATAKELAEISLKLDPGEVQLIRIEPR
jgi:hypothetical protein